MPVGKFLKGQMQTLFDHVIVPRDKYRLPVIVFVEVVCNACDDGSLLWQVSLPDGPIIELNEHVIRGLPAKTCPAMRVRAGRRQIAMAAAVRSAT